MASSNGWIIPTKDTLFGPTRRWIKPINLRSNKVKNATVNKTINKVNNQMRDLNSISQVGIEPNVLLSKQNQLPNKLAA